MFIGFKALVVFYLVNCFVIYFYFRKRSLAKYRVNIKIQDLREKINILVSRNSQLAQSASSLEEKISQYNQLKEIIEVLNQKPDLDYVADNLVEVAFRLITSCRGACLLFLIDKETQRPILLKTKKEDKAMVIKSKEGDIFDFWVLRHSAPLLIEDIKKDFRFDLNRVSAAESRPVSSLISSPCISENNFLGIIRLDSPVAHFYSQDDLRILTAISDIGSVALENSELFAKMQELAIRDVLTALYTKGYFLERLRKDCKSAIRKRKQISLLMIDIDHFKNYNDKFGHTAGDIVLKNLSQKLIDSLKDQDVLISRFGGEEFCVVALGKEKKDAFSLAEELRRQIEKMSVTLRRIPTNVTVSIGVASLPADAADEEELIRSADKAMYEAKQKGRNRTVCY